MKLLDFLASSQATPEFARALRAFAEEHRTNDRVVFALGNPPVKVERALTKLLESYPKTRIERVEINGQSGCEFYRGNLKVYAEGDITNVTFYWDCRWKAEEMGWNDYFGFPDQIRAARELGYDCFRNWEEDTPLVDVV